MTTGYYVSAINGRRTALIAGPFRSHKAALIMVDRVYKVACTVDPWSVHYAWGTAKLTSPNPLKPGRLNKFLEHGDLFA